VIVEAACHQALAEYQNSSASQPETLEEQKKLRESVNRKVLATPNGRGVGIFCWEPGVAPCTTGSRVGGRAFSEMTAMPCR
jgi:arabinogalactan endo-1,4-beta-galactosidase